MASYRCETPRGHENGRILGLDEKVIAKSARNINVFKYLLTKLSNNIDVFVIFRWSFTLAIFETIAETTQEILENWTFCYQLYTVQIPDNQTIERYNFW